MNRTLKTLVGVAMFLACLAPAALNAIEPKAFEGKPAFKEGDSFGYYVWKDGHTLKLRWTTFGAARHFTGAVRVEGAAELVDLKRIDVDAERRVLVPGRPARVVRGPRGRVVGVRPGRGAVVAETTADHFTRVDAKTVTFSTRTDDDLDGFDVKVTGEPERVRFTLEIDGRSRAVDVFVGRDNVHPADNPFVLVLR
jgi:hypothetical protein